MPKPKSVTINQAIEDLEHTFCDVPACKERANVIVESGELWIYFCKNHNPNKMKVVHSKKKPKKKSV